MRIRQIGCRVLNPKIGKNIAAAFGDAVFSGSAFVFCHDISLVFCFAVQFRGGFESLLYQVDRLFQRCDALLRFLLEAVQNINGAGKLHGVNGPVGVAGVGVYRLEGKTYIVKDGDIMHLLASV